jgi:hypothetical protein
VGARDSAPLWALFLGLAEAQHAAQAVRQARERLQQQQQQQPALPPVPRAWLHSEPWGAASSHADAPPAPPSPPSTPWKPGPEDGERRSSKPRRWWSPPPSGGPYRFQVRCRER